MLVLSRQKDEVIHIGPDIKITVVRIERNRVKLGIEAPMGVGIYRKEISQFDTRTISTSEIKRELGKIDVPLEGDGQ